MRSRPTGSVGAFFAPYVRGNGVIDLAALGCSLPLDEIYLKVAVGAR